MPPTAEPITGRARRNASITTRPMPSDRDELERLAAGARRAGEAWLVAPEEYARRLRELVVS